MKYVLLFLCLLLSASVQAQDIPMSLAGLTLGADISTAHQCCFPSTDILLDDERHLNEVQLKPQFVPGVKSGTVAYANCAQTGRIVRIKLKFDNPSRSFFNDLLDRYKKTFGNPEEWRGDPFQTVISWKWSFKDNTGQRVGLELTHSEDDDYKLGNFVKFTLRSLWDEEEACFNRSLKPAQRWESRPTPSRKLDYKQLIPR